MNYKWYFQVVLHIFATSSDCLHLKGTWNSQNAFYFFLSKFGFQKTTTHAATASQTSGYIYGNITSASTSASGLTLVLVDSEFFLDYYGNRTKLPRSQACINMFGKIDHAAFDSRCYPKGPEDFLRRIPCPRNQLCPDEDNPQNVIPGYQFTYTIQDLRKPRFWYLSFVACHLNSTDTSSCVWQHQKIPLQVDYDIWLVNGHPYTKHVNPFEHQFSFEQHDVFEIYATFLLLCCILIPLWTYAYRKQRHKLTQLFSVCIFLETVGILLNFIDTFKFAFDGVGVYWLHVAGDAIDSLAECLLVLLLLVIAKGWAITTRVLGGKLPLFTIWGGYTAVNTALFIWNLTELDIVSNMEQWDTVPGYIMLGVRVAVMFWFLLELRRTSVRETRLERLQFFQHFGAGFLVWFIYQPILAVISTQVSALWKRKTTLSMTYSADFLAFAALVHLLWPSRTVLNFVEKVTPLPPDEMEVAVLLESEPTFREIVRSEDSASGSESRGDSGKGTANGGHGHSTTLAAQRAKTNQKKTSQREDKTALIDYDDFSDYDSL